MPTVETIKIQADVKDAIKGIDKLEDAYPGMKRHLIEDDALKPGLAAIVGHTATRRGLLQKLDGDVEVHFVTAISGG